MDPSEFKACTLFKYTLDEHIKDRTGFRGYSSFTELWVGCVGIHSAFGDTLASPSLGRSGSLLRDCGVGFWAALGLGFGLLWVWVLGCFGFGVRPRP